MVRMGSEDAPLTLGDTSACAGSPTVLAALVAKRPFLLPVCAPPPALPRSFFIPGGRAATGAAPLLAPDITPRQWGSEQEVDRGMVLTDTDKGLVQVRWGVGERWWRWMWGTFPLDSAGGIFLRLCDGR
jgi:hypothetical protein